MIEPTIFEMNPQYKNDDVLKRLGEAVMKQRLRMKMTQEQAADRVVMSRERWSKLEHGHRNVTVVTVHQAANAVGSSIAQLVVEAFPEESDNLLATIKDLKNGKMSSPSKLRVGRKKKSRSACRVNASQRS